MIREYVAMWREIKHRNGISTALEDLLLAKGVEGVGGPLPDGMERGEPKLCFQNAGRLAFDGWTYCEGLAIRESLGLPLAHAWVLDDDGKVVDPTWDRPEETHYLGVVVPFESYRRAVLRHKVWGVLDTGLGLNMELISELMEADNAI
jgi:hypothetical protein